METVLTQAAEDARELAERTGTPLVVREPQVTPDQDADSGNYTQERNALLAGITLDDFKRFKEGPSGSR